MELPSLETMPAKRSARAAARKASAAKKGTRKPPASGGEYLRSRGLTRLSALVPIASANRMRSAAQALGVSIGELIDVAIAEHLARLESERGEKFAPRQIQLRRGPPRKTGSPK